MVNVIPDALNILGSSNVEKVYSNEGHSHFRPNNGLFVPIALYPTTRLCYHAAFRSA